MAEEEFSVNDFITLKLEKGDIQVYINGKLFNQCKSLILNSSKQLEHINSIDEAVELQENVLESFNHNISPKEEFWGHCSNLQAWVENNYDTRILHSNLAFPLLRELTKIGHLGAARVFKEEILKRFSKGIPNTQLFLLEEYFLDYFNEEERDKIFQSYQYNEEIRDKLRFYRGDINFLLFERAHWKYPLMISYIKFQMKLRIQLFYGAIPFFTDSTYEEPEWLYFKFRLDENLRLFEIYIGDLLNWEWIKNPKILENNKEKNRRYIFKEEERYYTKRCKAILIPYLGENHPKLEEAYLRPQGNSEKSYFLISERFDRRFFEYLRDIEFLKDYLTKTYGKDVFKILEKN